MSTMDSKLLDVKIKEMIVEINTAFIGLQERSDTCARTGYPNIAFNLHHFSKWLYDALCNLGDYPCFSSYTHRDVICKTLTYDSVNFDWLLSTIMNVCIVSERIGDHRYCKALFHSRMVESTLLVMMLHQWMGASQKQYAAIYLDEIDWESSIDFVNMNLYTKQCWCNIRGTTLISVELDYEIKEPIVNALPFKPGKLYRARDCQELEDAIFERAHTITRNIAWDNGIYYD